MNDRAKLKLFEEEKIRRVLVFWPKREVSIG
jgi:hypothetical protein